MTSSAAPKHSKNKAWTLQTLVLGISKPSKIEAGGLPSRGGRLPGRYFFLFIALKKVLSFNFARFSWQNDQCSSHLEALQLDPGNLGPRFLSVWAVKHIVPNASDDETAQNGVFWNENIEQIKLQKEEIKQAVADVTPPVQKTQVRRFGKRRF